jgi:ATP-dependent DNA ligase
MLLKGSHPRYLKGKDLRSLPLEQRKAMAQALLVDTPPILRFSASLQGDAARLLREVRSRGLEGLIAKQKDSKYEIERSGAWVRFKTKIHAKLYVRGHRGLHRMVHRKPKVYIVVCCIMHCCFYW